MHTLSVLLTLSVIFLIDFAVVRAGNLQVSIANVARTRCCERREERPEGVERRRAEEGREDLRIDPCSLARIMIP